MQCPRCQAPNHDDAKFCEDCGARMDTVCPSCGQPVGTGKKFCRSCGTLQSYTPKHLAERILTSRSALEGERKQVTILFADLKGSMELLANRDPEDARRILDPVLERMMEAFHRGGCFSFSQDTCERSDAVFPEYDTSALAVSDS
jgi:predicted amidophosphoribosyltransferase